MKKTILSLFFLLTTILCSAQTELPTISADRPGATESTDIMPRFKIQWETGFGFTREVGISNKFTLNNTLVRFGLFENTELRIGTDLLIIDEIDQEQFFGMEPLTYGLKTRFYEGEGAIPSVGMLAELGSSRVGSDRLLSTYLPIKLTLMADHEFECGIGLCYNIGLHWDGNSASPTTYLGFGISYAITDKISTFAESYNFFTRDDNNSYFTELGFSWIVSRKVQVDLAGDIRYNEFDKFFAISAGVAWLIN